MKSLSKKKLRLFILITLLICLIQLIVSLGTAIINKEIKFEEKGKKLIIKDESLKNIISYNIFDFAKAMISKNDVYIEKNVIYQEKCSIKITTSSDKNLYKIEYGINEKNLNSYNIKEKIETIDIELKEGKNIVFIKLYENNKNIINKTEEVYYIKPYKKQFLDELENNGISNKVTSNLDIDKSINLTQSLGVNTIRYGIWWGYVEKNNQFDYSLYDTFVKRLEKENLKSYVILGEPMSVLNGRKKILSKEDFEKYKKYVDNTLKRYPNIKNFEILNEPNMLYYTEEELNSYINLINEVKNRKVNVFSGSTAIIQRNNIYNSTDFINKIMKKSNNRLDRISFHPYDSTRETLNNEVFIKLLNNHKKELNGLGGFTSLTVSEYGITTYKNITEEDKIFKLVKQIVKTEEFENEYNIIYCLRDTGTDINNKEHNFGLITNDYKPKKSYYAMKNYYTNTNGAEYIGNVNIASGLEAHIYDKDGKPVMIAWSENSNNTIKLPYQNFKAYDIYGKEIANIDGNLNITTSPVYLKEIDNSYFYKAIAKMSKEKYSEFLTNFEAELNYVPAVKNSVNSLINYMNDIENGRIVSGEEAINKLKEHYQIGTELINAKKNGTLKIEYVKLSSMLDFLNDIGESFEDLVTVSCNDLSIVNLAEVSDLIDLTKNELEIFADTEPVYPEKILNFAEDLYEKSSYINSLEEENPIKNGLIISHYLHSKELANWSNEFLGIYKDSYYNEVEATLEYSTTRVTNKPVTVTLKINKPHAILNNEHKDTYIFNNNGEFTFEYSIKGEKHTITARVNWIDLESPIIENIKEGETYFESVYPKAKENDIRYAKLYLNNTVIEGYVFGDKIEQEGSYLLIAYDKANNETSVNFKIKYDTVLFNYEISDKFLIGIEKGTSVEKLSSNSNYEVYRNGNKIAKNILLVTGDKVVANGKEYFVIVKGDINKDGLVNVVDLMRLRSKVIEAVDLDEIETKSADINNDGAINIKDVTILRSMVSSN